MWNFLTAMEFWGVVFVAVLVGGIKEYLNVNNHYYGIKGTKFMELMTGLSVLLILIYALTWWQHGWVAPIVCYAVVFITAIPAGNIAHRGKR